MTYKMQRGFKDGINLYVKDFGAIGDGVKNDSSAIRKALTALKHSPKGSTLIFDENKTYYVSSGKIALDLKDLHDVAIKGCNSVILAKPIMSLCRIYGCSNVDIIGITFDYKTRPYAIADVLDVYEDGKIRIRANRSLNIRGTYKQPVVDYFGLVDRPDGRYHVGITTYKVVDHNSYIYDVKCNTIFAERDLRLRMMKDNKYKFIIPMPHIGQVIEHAVRVICNENVSMIDCNVKCAAKFMFFVKGNKGKVLFKGLKVDNDSDVPIVGWRDGFHCKENRAQIIWDGCIVRLLCDDIIKMSVSLLQIQQKKENTISLYCQETGTPYLDAEVGDEITFLNTDTGAFLGKRIIQNITIQENYIDICVDKDIDGVVASPSCKAYISALGAKNSIVKNCDLHGTFRFRSPIHITDSKIHVTRMWIDFEPPFEGPVAENILFDKCDILFDDDYHVYIHVDSKNNNWEKTGDPYRVKNIVFSDCNIRENAVELGAAEQKYSVVKFIKSTKECGK